MKDLKEYCKNKISLVHLKWEGNLLRQLVLKLNYVWLCLSYVWNNVWLVSGVGTLQHKCKRECDHFHLGAMSQSFMKNLDLSCGL